MIKGIKSLKRFIGQFKSPVVGFGKTAFTRSGPAFLLPHYQIICIEETPDTKDIRRRCRVLSLEKDLGGEALRQDNTSSILQQSQVQGYLKNLNGFWALIYRSSLRIERYLGQLSDDLLVNRAVIANPFEDKKEFRCLAAQAQLPILPGETLFLGDLDEEEFRKLQKKYGESLVLQLTDYKVGGGIGTVFVKNIKEFHEFLTFVQHRRDKGKKLEWVNVTPFVEGQAASIIGMVTKEGVLAGPLQLQLIDVPEVTAFYGRHGVFCGHDWQLGRFNSNLQRKAESLVRTWGNFIAQKGYKGIFGIDVVVTSGSPPSGQAAPHRLIQPGFAPDPSVGRLSRESTNTQKLFPNQNVFPIECNARYTGAFPAYAMLQLEADEPNFDLFQLAEFLKLDYTFNFEEAQRQWRESKTGAQLILHNQTRHWIKIKGAAKAGVYRWHKGEIEWLRPGFAMQDIFSPANEFILTDGVPVKGKIYKPGERLGRLLFKHCIAAEHNRIGEQEKGIVKAIYHGYQIEEIENPEEN